MSKKASTHTLSPEDIKAVTEYRDAKQEAVTSGNYSSDIIQRVLGSQKRIPKGLQSELSQMANPRKQIARINEVLNQQT